MALIPGIYLAPDAFLTRDGKLMGRQSAGTGFLRAFAQSFSAGGERLQVIHTPEPETGWFQRQLRDLGWQSEIETHASQAPETWPHGVLYYPAPISTELAWLRDRQGVASMALCGVTHTISSIGVLQQIEAQVSGPFAPWDALVCTSNSVRKVVHEVWQSEKNRLARRLGVPMVHPRLPMTPVIPLGVHADDFKTRPELRRQARAAWGVADDDLVVLFVGRLSFHSKANPVPMYHACARAKTLTARRIQCVEFGMFANSAVEKSYQQAANACGIEPIRMSGREHEHLRLAYAGADVFLSLSDNIQESFGLTPLEAMASGLPVIVSDWDGYKESVREGQDGFLISTSQNGHAPSFQPLVDQYVDGRLNYDMYIAHAHLQVAVDIGQCAQRLAMFANDPSLRLKMGASGQDRVRQFYDWRVVMPQYQNLWLAQEEMRLGHRTDDSHRAPSASNPLKLFDHYPTVRLAPDTPLCQDLLAQPDLRTLSMWAFARTRIKGKEELWAARESLPKPGDPPWTLSQWAHAHHWSVEEAFWQASFLLKIGWIRIAHRTPEQS
jgi:alpha-maltose-1-phosphate synthase